MRAASRTTATHRHATERGHAYLQLIEDSRLPSVVESDDDHFVFCEYQTPEGEALLIDRKHKEEFKRQQWINLPSFPKRLHNLAHSSPILLLF